MAQTNFESAPTRFFRGEIANRWQQLTTSEIDECCTNRSRLASLLKSRYGYAPTRAEKEVQLFFEELRDRLRLAG